MYSWASHGRWKIQAHNEPEGHTVNPWKLRPANKTFDCVHLLKAGEEIKQRQPRRSVELLTSDAKSLTMSRGGKSLLTSCYTVWPYVSIKVECPRPSQIFPFPSPFPPSRNHPKETARLFRSQRKSSDVLAHLWPEHFFCCRCRVGAA